MNSGLPISGVNTCSLEILHVQTYRVSGGNEAPASPGPCAYYGFLQHVISDPD